MQSTQPRIFEKIRTGFTLIELLVVVGIIAILMAILLPTLGRARDQAKLTHCASGMRQWGMALQYYLNEYDQWLPQKGDESGTTTTGDWNVELNTAWFNALPPYANCAKYCYIYQGDGGRTGNRKDLRTDVTYTVGSPNANTGYKNSWIWYCQGRLDKQKNSSTFRNSFHYAMNGLLNGQGGNYGASAPPTSHVKLTNIPTPSQTVFLFETNRNLPSDAPAANPTTSLYCDYYDIERHKGPTNILLLDARVESNRVAKLPVPTRASTSLPWKIDTNTTYFLGPYPYTKVVNTTTDTITPP